MIWLSTGILSAGSAVYFHSKSNTYYDESKVGNYDYQQEMKKKTEQYDIYKLVALGISGLSFVEVIIQSSKQKKIKQSLALHTSPYKDGACFTLSYNF